MLRRHKVDGIVIGSHTLEIDEYLKIGLFIVALDRFLGDTIPTVSADHRKGGYLAARELINNGCKHVAQFMGEPRVSTPANERYYAFEEEMKKNNIACETINVGWNVFNIEDVINPVKEVLDKYDDIDGIFGSDMVAASALKEAERRGIDVPSHLKIVGYDGIFVTKITSPEITTIKQPMPEIADSIVKLMIDQINGKRCEPKLHIKLDVALIKGGTTI
jgi:LacI family sucrose operon transcriptional repressor